MFKNIPSFFRKHTSFYRFATVGISCFILEYLLFTILHILIGDIEYPLRFFNITGIFIANSTSYIISSFLSFRYNRKWTFKSNGSHTIYLMRFIILFTINLFVSNWLIHFLDDTSVNPQIGKLIASLIICVWNYFVNKFFVFRK